MNLNILSRLVWMQVIVKAVLRVKCRIPSLRLPSQGFYLQVIVTQTCGTCECGSSAVAAPLAKLVQNAEAHTLFCNVPVLTSIVQAFKERLRVYKYSGAPSW